MFSTVTGIGPRLETSVRKVVAVISQPRRPRNGSISVRPLRSVLFIGAALAGWLFAGAGSGEDKTPGDSGAWSPEKVWENFSTHWKAAGRGELETPDFEAGDPIFPVLLKESADLIKLQALLEESQPSPERAAKVEEILKKLGEEKDPYVREYGKLFSARHALESGEKEKINAAMAELKALVRSPHFLGQTDAHRQLAASHRKLGEETLAILELRLYLNNLPESSFADRRWAREQLKEIRKNHKGPLHDCADRAEAVAKALSEDAAAKTAPASQREVEGILEKAIDLLENGKSEKAAAEPAECPTCKKTPCESPCPKCGSCMKSGQCTAEKCSGAGKGRAGASGQAGGSKHSGQEQKSTNSGQRQLEEILEATIYVLEDAARRASAKSGKEKGSGKGKGDPDGTKPSDQAAQDTKLAKGEAPELNLKDPKGKDAEAWGQINDREVARSLRELWGKIPVSYRSLVIQYFKDITDLEPAPPKK